jgi:PadR family transcriptional regulator
MDSKLLSGAVDMLILHILQSGPSYGYDIAQQTLKRSEGYFELKEGSLYPALHRLERKGLLESFWEQTESARRRKYYKLTALGLKNLKVSRNEWEAFTHGVKGILDTGSLSLDTGPEGSHGMA